MKQDSNELERQACIPVPVSNGIFNSACQIPYGCTVEHLQSAMNDWIEFLGFINLQLNSRNLDRLEMLLMQANFSSLVGEFMHQAITKYCPTLIKNRRHNGHPDLVPVGGLSRQCGSTW